MPLPLDSALLTRVTMTACRELGVSPGILDDLPAYEVECFWRQVPDGQFADAPKRTDEADAFTHKILIVPDLQSPEASASSIAPGAPAEAPWPVVAAQAGHSAKPVATTVPVRSAPDERVWSESARSRQDDVKHATGSPGFTETIPAPVVAGTALPRNRPPAHTVPSSDSQLVSIPAPEATSIAAPRTASKPAAQAVSIPAAQAALTPTAEAAPIRAALTPGPAERGDDQPLTEAPTTAGRDARPSITVQPQPAEVIRDVSARRQPSVSRFRVVSGSAPAAATPRLATVAFVSQPLTRAEPVDFPPLAAREWPWSQASAPAGASMPEAFEPFARRVGD